VSRYRVAVDVGGTFTDIFVFEEESGRISVTKVPSVPDDPAKGILAGIRLWTESYWQLTE
jgi:N-methylhydantoinase A